MWWQSPVVQVLLGIIVVIAVYVLACKVVGSEGLVLSAKREMLDRKSEVMVLPGHGSLLSVADKAWSTSNQFASNYVPLQRSLNQRGGIEFSYAFWLKVDGEDGAKLSHVANQMILMRGDRRRFRWQMNEQTTVGGVNKSTAFGPGILVCCPSISFGRSYNEFKVNYNTLQEPMSGFVVEARPNEERALRQNALKLMLNEWALMTFVFRDRTPSNDFDDGIEVSVYLNDSLYYMHRSQGAFKVNQGDLYVAPSISGDPKSGMNHVQIGDLQYTNYAMKQKDVEKMYKKGPPKKSFKESRRSASPADPLYLTEYNKLDIYNT